MDLASLAGPVPRPDRGLRSPDHLDCERQGVPVLADRACQGVGPWVTTGRRGPPGGQFSPTQQTVKRALADATGLTEEEITTAVAAADGNAPMPADSAPAATAVEPETIPDTVAADDTAPDVTEPAEVPDMAAVLAWADQHTLAGVRGKAARIRADLADLDQRRGTEQATAEAEERIAKLRADLKAEEDTLWQLKTGGPRATTRDGDADPDPPRHREAPARGAHRDPHVGP